MFSRFRIHENMWSAQTLFIHIYFYGMTTLYGFNLLHCRLVNMTTSSIGVLKLKNTFVHGSFALDQKWILNLIPKYYQIMQGVDKNCYFLKSKVVFLSQNPLILLFIRWYFKKYWIERTTFIIGTFWLQECWKHFTI